MVLVAVGGDAQNRMALSKGPPQRALTALQAPPGLVHVDVPGQADLLEQVLIGLPERVADARQDRVDRAA